MYHALYNNGICNPGRLSHFFTSRQFCLSRGHLPLREAALRQHVQQRAGGKLRFLPRQRKLCRQHALNLLQPPGITPRQQTTGVRQIHLPISLPGDKTSLRKEGKHLYHRGTRYIQHPRDICAAHAARAQPQVVDGQKIPCLPTRQFHRSFLSRRRAAHFSR